MGRLYQAICLIARPDPTTVFPTETSEADACSATFVAADHAKVILSYQP